MTPYVAKGAKTYKLRIRLEDGRDRVCSCGTTAKAVAKDVERFVETLKAERRWATLLGAIVDGRVFLPDAYDARYDLDGFVAALDDVDLEPFVAEWARVARSAKYVTQLRRLMPEGERFPRSRFTRKTISTFLAGLRNERTPEKPASGPTRNRYRVALMQFAKWLVEREVVESNPVRDVAGFGERPPRMVYHTRDQAKALVLSLTDPRQRALEALMAGTGIEWGAAQLVSRRGIRPDTREVWAEGGKTAWRRRWVRCTEDWAWRPFWAYAKDFTEAGQLFAGLREKDALAAHRTACTALSLPSTTLHDWRHSYAIYSLDDGIKPATVRRQLGHAPNSTVLERVYAAHLPSSDADYEKRFVRVATNPATSGEKRREVRRANR